MTQELEATRHELALVEITRRRYPDLCVPLHSRWRHFSAGGVDRAALIAPRADAAETARARIDLAVVSVLLDAGTGPDWCYHDKATDHVLSRSEGLAVASLRAMQAGTFSADPSNPWRADAEALLEITPQKLAGALQHTADNELVGLEGRAVMMRRLGEACAASPTLFGVPARLGGLYDHWSARGEALPRRASPVPARRGTPLLDHASRHRLEEARRLGQLEAAAAVTGARP